MSKIKTNYDTNKSNERDFLTLRSISSKNSQFFEFSHHEIPDEINEENRSLKEKIPLTERAISKNPYKIFSQNSSMEELSPKDLPLEARLNLYKFPKTYQSFLNSKKNSEKKNNFFLKNNEKLFKDEERNTKEQEKDLVISKEFRSKKSRLIYRFKKSLTISRLNSVEYQSKESSLSRNQKMIENMHWKEKLCKEVIERIYQREYQSLEFLLDISKENFYFFFLNFLKIFVKNIF